MLESTASRDVLFVDDEPDILRALERTTRRAAWRSVFAGSGAAGLAEAERHTFAVVVSDFVMPGMNGVDFLARMRERHPNTERILLTANADQEAMEKGINTAGISRFLRKPWRGDVLQATIEEALKQHQLRHDNAVLLRRLEHRNQELGYLNQKLQDRVEAGHRDILAFRRRWDVAFNAISDPMIVITPDFVIEGANHAAGALAGVAPDTLEGEKCHQALFQKDAPCVGCPVGTGHGRIEMGPAQDRRLYDLRAYGIPGDSPSYLRVYRDVTREVAFAREAAQLEKLAAVGRLAAGMAHEINNPLSGILSFVQLAQKPEVDPDKRASFHAHIHDCAMRCRNIVQGLRDFARTPKPEDWREVSWRQVCARALILFTGLKDRTLEPPLAGEDLLCRGNLNELAQVVVNLVQNAVDASPPQGHIRISLARDGNEVVMAVDDAGPGVPPEQRDKVFEPFYTTKPEGMGTGLGLAISHGIVSAHGGTLRVETSPLGGARFEVRLPGITGATP